MPGLAGSTVGSPVNIIITDAGVMSLLTFATDAAIQHSSEVRAGSSE